MKSVRLPLMQFAEIERLALNWSNPRLDEQRLAFRGSVQAALAQAASRGMAHSPPTYFTVEKLAQQEVEQRGRTMLDGYKQALTAAPSVVSQEIVARKSHIIAHRRHRIREPQHLWNASLLHLGHWPAASSSAGRVKCFIYPQSLHFHRIERCSSDS